MPQRGDLIRFINDQQIERVGIVVADQSDERGDVSVVPLSVLRALLVNALQLGLITPVSVPHSSQSGGGLAYWASGAVT